MPGTFEPMAAVAPGNDLQEAAPTKGFVLIGVAIAFGWPLVLLIPGVSGLNITNTRDDAVNIVVKWLVVAGLCMIAFRAQRRPPWDPAFDGSPFEPLQVERDTDEITIDLDDLLTLYSTTSALATLPTHERDELFARVRPLLAGPYQLPLKHELTWTRLAA